MSKVAYDSAFAIMKSQNEACNQLETLGCRFEYDSGPLGKFLLNLMNKSETIIIDSLGLHEVSKPINCIINQTPYQTTIEILYTKEEDDNWSITLDDFFDFVYSAAHSSEIRDLFWKAMTEKDESAKNEFNTKHNGKIGAAIKYLNK